MTDLLNQTLAQIVTSDHRTASVFEKYKLDFCCRGKRKLTNACAEMGISPADVKEALLTATAQSNLSHLPFNEMSAADLVGYIVSHHHFYVRHTMPQILMHLEKVATKHGDRFPAMIKVRSLFAELNSEMLAHLKKEEVILFPAILQATSSQDAKPLNEELIVSAIRMMETEHDQAGDIMTRIRVLTSDYEIPAGACNTFRLSLSELRHFENDLHQHVHLENNILFPIAMQFLSTARAKV